ncbi:MAG: TadE/TadG family type IV pilus assembly protein [Streptosporangiaceae bacterium]
MAIEVAILAPVIVIFMLLMIGLGRVVEAKAQVGGAARDAARAASVQRYESGAQQAAEQAASRDLANWCVRPPTVVRTGGVFAPGALITYEVRCRVDLTGLEVIGFTPTKTVTEDATAPIDTYRRVG